MAVDTVRQTEQTSVLERTQQLIKKALEHMGFAESFYELLKRPRRLMTVCIPIRMDDGSVRVFTGYRAQHNDAVGPTKGGIRFHPAVTPEEVTALSMEMSIQCGLIDLPYGGGMGGIECDPRTMSAAELERLSRGYVRAISQIVGPTKDILAPDMYTNAQMMAWMLDEYSRLREFDSPGLITGKPLMLGGSAGRESSTVKGVTIVLREAAKVVDMQIGGARVIVQGFGHAGGYLAKFLHDAGAKIVGIADTGGALYHPDGLDVDYLLEKRDASGAVTHLFASAISNRELLVQACDILIPAAAENQITEENAADIQAKIVIEAANGPTTAKATEILTSRGVLLVPDVLASAGGVVASYFERVQNNQGCFWSEAEVYRKLDHLLVNAFRTVHGIALESKVDMRLAVYMAGLRKMAEAMRWRGWV
ncbi:Glu/Leu/Phe/Val family dehydrogenase [Paenibacillus elgii]|uniref:Glu/Leu/Phe/Val family dehydrogenase n=1 Tax=Paenibacillus elgii TaxID=189691 RepID=UPI00203A7BB3|nr:Glu/Leu/Phe/Val dehydrogenase [Paenibacillus elgii]MCM3269083.1 Glu/Leu/Phe/Val dehydrogenase [Paenibacillus elgii]